MNTAKEFQKHLEKRVCERLINYLKHNVNFIRYGNDIDEPDCIYKLNDELLGIEVSTAYLSNGYAKRIREHRTGERKFSKEGEWLFDNPIYPNNTIRERIQNRIDVKCSKNYTGVEKIWLCIEEENPFSNEASVKKLLKSIKVPEKHCFRLIYLLLHEGGDYKAFTINGD